MDKLGLTKVNGVRYNRIRSEYMSVINSSEESYGYTDDYSNETDARLRALRGLTKDELNLIILTAETSTRKAAKILNMNDSTLRLHLKKLKEKIKSKLV